ncbi:L,D-transpeptidase [Nocardia puris]|uniref:Lipoprotein-anchoring transpeptidase ErfK/SrfK n=1 Tax=Nocardia puris TaxID=208602 RepID=A0A366DQY0_9NOCA|nr:L,D-transpeptidase [Nocardia puris]RBO91628.1 lipoprotein-anchoring transpeptidase ErfK/SrfK [Nocardia puris]
MHAASNTRSLPTSPREARATRRLRQGVLLSAAIAAAGAMIVAPAQADPALPGLGAGSAAVGVEPEPQPNFAPPNINIADGETVGVAQPIIITFKEPIADRALAEKVIKVTSSKEAPGHFYWFSDRQVRWRPNEFWPDNTDVRVEAGGTSSSFRIGDAIVTTADDATKTITVTRNGEVVKTMPTSLGKPKYETPNGTYIVGERHREMVMDSSTYGVPIDAPEGYKLDVEYATRLSNSGIFLHAAPWSVGSQGVANVSHGCLNVSTEDARWFFENVQKGDPVIVQNTAGGTLNSRDGLGDWN